MEELVRRKKLNKITKSITGENFINISKKVESHAIELSMK